MAKQTPTIGRIVHYVLQQGPRSGEHRPAIIVAVHSETTVNLQVFTDSNEVGRFNDAPAIWSAESAPTPLRWVTSAVQDEDTHAPNTWHWPERA